MRATSANPENEATSRRPWYRLHLSTWAVIALSIAFFLIVAVPRNIRIVKHSGDSGAISGKGIYQNGWPWYYLEWSEYSSSSIRTPKPDISKASWLVFEAWNFFDNNRKLRKFSLCRLILDILVAAIAVAAVAFLFEFRRRLRTHWFQFTLRELLLLTALVAAALSWWQTNRNRHVRESEIMNRFSLPCYKEEYRGPHFLQALCGNGLLSDFFIVTQFQWYPWTKTSAEEFERHCSCLHEFAGLETVELENTLNQPFDADKLISQLSPLKQIRYMLIRRSNLSDSSMEIISRFGNLEELEISETAFSSRGLRSLGSLPRLQKLALRYDIIDDESAEILGGMTNLKELDITRSRISEKGMKQLRSQLPENVAIKISD